MDLGCFGGLQRRRLLGKCRKGSQGSSWMGANDSRAPGHRGRLPDGSLWEESKQRRALKGARDVKSLWGPKAPGRLKRAKRFL